MVSEPLEGRWEVPCAYLAQRLVRHHQRIRAGSRLMEVKASALLRAVRVENVGVVAEADTRPVVEVGAVVARETDVEDGDDEVEVEDEDEAAGIRVAGFAGSSGRAEHVGKPRGLLRCRVPYWPDALPWRRSGSQMTAVAAKRAKRSIG